ncbi:response regulator [Nannocystis pusilla]|uniref:response regulator n=1 Tax=Nannocystis pusilla TaxID=889268 RepID=UPI003B7A3531
MASLFIVEDDSHFRGELTRELEGRGFQVASAPSVHSALAALARRPADVVLTDLRLGGPDGLDLLKLLPSVSRRTRSILMSAHASARDHQVATELGAIDVLIKPFTPAELLRSIHKAIDCETGFVGSVHGLSLIDVAQMFHLAQRSVTIVVTATGRPASKIHLRRGEIVGASHGDLVGCAALRAILAASSGRCTPPASRTTRRRRSTRPSIICCWPA